MPRLLIAASGTGGHINPALAVAEALPGSWEFIWLGVPDRLDKEILPENVDLITVNAGAIQGNYFNKIIQLIRLIVSIKIVINLIREKKIDAVFTTGGYISAPAILAAKISRIPVIFHESNAFPGRVTRLLGRFCTVVALGLPHAQKFLPIYNSVVTGTPVRKLFYIPQSLPDWVPIGSGPLIVVIGGSQGAMGLNKMVRYIAPFLIQKGCRLVHLTGENDRNCLSLNKKYFVSKTYSNQMPALLQHADLVISRSGSGTLSELAVSGTPSILVPYPFSANNHQELNAADFASRGAAVIVHEHPPTQKDLLNTVEFLLRGRLIDSQSSDDLLAFMSKSMTNMAPKFSEKVLINIIQSSI